MFLFHSSANPAQHSARARRRRRRRRRRPSAAKPLKDRRAAAADLVTSPLQSILHSFILPRSHSTLIKVCNLS